MHDACQPARDKITQCFALGQDASLASEVESARGSRYGLRGLASSPIQPSAATRQRISRNSARKLYLDRAANQPCDRVWHGLEACTQGCLRQWGNEQSCVNDASFVIERVDANQSCTTLEDETCGDFPSAALRMLLDCIAGN